MLSRAALRLVRPSTRLPLRPAPPSAASSIRTFADRPRRPPPPPPPPPKNAKPVGRPVRPAPPPPAKTSGQAVQQTSPGTTLPKDQTWRPQDAIKFAGAAVPTAANEVNRREDAAQTTSVDGTRPDGDAVRQDVLEPETKQQEPVAQQVGADEPEPGSLRDRVQDQQARAANTPPPPSPEQPVSEEPTQPQQPLPDLRQGLPSTFDIEFGGKQADQVKSERPSEQTDGVDVTTTPPRDRQRSSSDDGSSDDRSYDRSAYETSLDRKRERMANILYLSILFGITSGAFYLARPFNARDEPPPHLDPDDVSGWSPGKMYARVRARLGSQMGYYTEPTFPKLLPEVPESQRPPYTLVLSLEDLMIHSTWDRKHGYRTAKRPGIDYFIRYLSQYYELVLFTSVPLSMADPVIKKLDPYHFILWPLGREATKYEGGEYIKDLSYLNRPLSKTIIIDTHAPHVKNQPENAIILPKWSGDPKDAHTGDLVRLIPFLENLAAMGTEDVRPVLASFRGKDIPTEFARRESLARAEFQNQLAAQKKPRVSLGSVVGALGVKSQPQGMVLGDGQSVAEGLARGKMLSDQIREQGQKQYEMIERQIREHGAEWLREEEEEQKKAVEAQMKEMKKGALGWFGGSAKE